MRWPAWLRPGGELATRYDVPTPVIGAEALRVARKAEEVLKAVKDAGISTSDVSGLRPSPDGLIAWAGRAASSAPAVTLTDDQVDRLADEAGIDVGTLAPVVEAAMAKAMEMPYLVGDVRNPAPGLAETIAAGVPPWAEMQAKYPPLPWRKVDPEKIRAKLRPELFKDARAMDEWAAFSTQHAMAAAKAMVESIKASEVVSTDAGEVDFRAMLKDDDAAWSAKTRLAKVLGREYLATRLVDQLDPETAAQLADRLDTLVSQAIAETEMRISGEVQGAVSAYSEQLAADRAARRKQAEEASRERFHGHSRLS